MAPPDEGGLIKSLTTKFLKSFRFPQGVDEDRISKGKKSGKYGFGNTTARFWIFGGKQDDHRKSTKFQGTFARATSKFWNNLTSKRFVPADVHDDDDDEEDRKDKVGWFTKTKSIVSQFALKAMRKEVRIS